MKKGECARGLANLTMRRKIRLKHNSTGLLFSPEMFQKILTLVKSMLEKNVSYAHFKIVAEFIFGTESIHIFKPCLEVYDAASCSKQVYKNYGKQNLLSKKVCKGCV